jgi:hypothetical protein
MNDELVKKIARKAGLIAPYGSDTEGLRDFDYREFAKLILEDVVESISHAGLAQLDIEYAKIYSHAVANRFGYKIEEPYLTIIPHGRR